MTRQLEMVINPREDVTTYGTPSGAAAVRREIDASTNRYLFVMHGGASVALLALLAVIIPNPDLDVLTRCVIVALLVYQFGVVCSVFHNIARRRCSNEYEAANRQGKDRPDPCRCLGLTIRGGCQCLRELVWRSLAIVLFLLGSITVATGAWAVLSQPADDGMVDQVALRPTCSRQREDELRLPAPAPRRVANSSTI